MTKDRVRPKRARSDGGGARGAVRRDEPSRGGGAASLDALRWNEGGLVPAVVQDADSGVVLMLGWMDREAVTETLAAGEVHFHSRSRGVLWRKGATSGNTLDVVGILADCDRDALLVLARPHGNTCHTGEPSCFHDLVAGDAPLEGLTLGPLFAVLQRRQAERPAGSYTVALFDDADRALKKLVEEAAEVALGAKNADRDNLTWEVADLLYHLAVVMTAHRIAPADVNRELARRAGGGER